MRKSNISKISSTVSALLFASLAISFSGCALPYSLSSSSTKPATPPAAKAEIVGLPSEGITLIWEYPLSENPVSAFDIAYADADAANAEWTVLSTVAASESLEFDIDAEAIPQGDWIIGVKASDADGNVSAWHSSLASDAVPSNGWILRKP